MYPLDQVHNTLEWQISIPVFKNSIILKQLSLVIGMPFGLIILFLVLTSWEQQSTRYAVYVILALLALTALFVLIVYRGKYDVEYLLDQKGVRSRTQEKQAKRNRRINKLTVLAGMVSKNPSVAGAGMLAQTRQEEYLNWKKITKTKFKPKGRTVHVRGGVGEWIVIFCTQENYRYVEQFVLNKTSALNSK